MSDDLLPYYNRELAYIRRLAADFAETHPKIAARLRLGPDSSEDPHVERLIEAFAYLNARTRFKLEDDFPEITDAILGVLYPHYQAPIPSMAIVQFLLDPTQSGLTGSATIPAQILLETESIQGEPVRFRTSYPVTLWPIELQEASLIKQPFQAPTVPQSSRATAVVRLVLRCHDPGMTFAQLAPESLRFFLKGQPQHVYPLYELIFNHTLEVVVASSSLDPKPARLGPESIQAVGFGLEEGMLDYPARSFLGYRLLTELFAFPEKFLFFDLTSMGAGRLTEIGNQLEIYFYVSRTSPDLEQNVSADTFRLACTPIVNLYRQRAEPIQLTHTDWEYRVVPDARRPLSHEVYAIEKVVATSPDGEAIEYAPFFSVKHSIDPATRHTFWHATRRGANRTEGQVDQGTEVYLSLVDLGLQPSAPADWTLDVETTCVNRDLPHRLPFGGDQPRLQFMEGGALVSRIACLTPPTRTLRPARKHGAMWRLISHLCLNHLSIAEGEDAALALREILKLYDFTDSAETRSMIEGILSVTSQRVVSRVRLNGQWAVSRGVEVTILLDGERFSGSGLFLFAAVLERFLSLYCTVNSFSRLIVTIKGREGELRRWPARMGDKILL